MILAVVLVSFGIIFLVSAFWNGLVVKNYIVRSNKIRERIKIVLITDLHSHIYGKNQKNIANKIKKASPDLIVLSGDIVDDIEPVEGAEQFFEAIKDIADIYYVTGNHDKIFVRIGKNLKKILRIRGITALSNKYIETNINGNDIIIGGLDDPGINRRRSSKEYAKKLENRWERNANVAFKDLKDDGKYKILLSHRPDKTDIYGKLPFDMILSGHAHGGQVRIPFILNGLYAPNQGLFPKYAGGLYKYKDKTHIVSRGVAFNIIFPRIFNPPEIVVITLSP